jgi:hypothetical protein
MGLAKNQFGLTSKSIGCNYDRGLQRQGLRQGQSGPIRSIGMDASGGYFQDELQKKRGFAKGIGELSRSAK